MEQDDSEAKWRFSENGHQGWNGFNTSHIMTFSKDPIAHFAREICQNSIDARRDDVEGPVRIEFKTFDIHYDSIPGYYGLKGEINICRNYQFAVGNKTNSKIADGIFTNICGDRLGHIRCLRVSDYNTTGLYGAKERDIRLPFYSLAFGSGSSQKGAGMAGSRGIGKYAAFVISKTNTVFYSTHAFNSKKNEIEDAFIGITRLCSRPIDEKTNLATTGEGCYGSGVDNAPIMEQLWLERGFNRADDEYGTDLYIIGFNEGDSWKGEIIKKVLDSFIVAIIKGLLEVNVDGIELNKGTLPVFIDKIKALPYLNKIDKRIIAQYDIFSNLDDESIKEKIITIKDCDIHLYAKTYSRDDRRFATNGCSRIRFPYMKIDDVNINSFAGVSAAFIIEKNYVNDTLRDIENPQHTEWQPKQIRDDKDKYKESLEILNSLSNELIAFINEIVVSDESESTDLEGAGEYLSDDEDTGDDSVGDDTISSGEDKTFVSVPVRKKTTIRGNSQSNDGSPDSVHSSGELDDDGDTLGVKEPVHKQHNPKPGPNPDPHPNQEDIQAWGEGIKPFLKQIISKNTRFRCIKPANGEFYEIMFLADSTHEKCDIQLSSIGDNNDTEKVTIKAATVNGKEAAVGSGRIIGLSIEEGKKYKILCRIDRESVFASKVLMCAYKKAENHEDKK